MKACLLVRGPMDKKNTYVSDADQSKRDGRLFLLVIIGFFLVVASVDAFFIYKALSTHSGVVAENAYEIGLNYNDVIAEAKKKNNHGSGRGE